jgi:hypothetical protein
MTIRDDSNFNTKETEKLSKYKDLEIEFSRMWQVRRENVPLKIGVLRTNKTGLDQKLQFLPGHPSTKELYKITLMSTAHIIGTVLW